MDPIITADITPVIPQVEVDIYGVRGARGYSPYELAVAEGYEGSLGDWLESLKGNKGDKGDRGDKGDSGVPTTIYVDGAYCLNLIFPDGTRYKSQSLRGARGTSIRSIELKPDYGLLITFSDGTTSETTSTRGEKGERGYGIESAELNQDYTLTLTFEDGRTYTTPSIRGEVGPTYTLTAEDKAEIYDKVLLDYPSVEEVEF